MRVLFSKSKGLIQGLCVLALGALFTYCSDSSQSKNSKKQILKVPVKVQIKIPQSLNLEQSYNPSLNLASIGTNLIFSITGCDSGYSFSSGSIDSGAVDLYKGDGNCLVKLEQFTLGADTYSKTGGTDFTTWLANDIASFKNTSDSHTINVFVESQITQAGVLVSDNVTYTFTDAQEGTTSSIIEANVSTPATLTVEGKDAPDFDMLQARYLSTNSNGSANMSFTLQCSNELTGSSNPTYACSGDLLDTHLDYIFITDAYGQGAITVDQANDAFVANTPTAVNSLIVAPGNQDLHSNTMPKGGFYTSDASPLVTGTDPVFTNSLSNVFMIRRKDGSGNTLSYLYFYVEITSITQTYNEVSACGGTFGGGSGTVGDPYLIQTRTHLESVGLCSSSSDYFKLSKSLDLGGSGNPWVPMDLYGQFNGNNFTISDLYIHSDAYTNSGLFGTIQSGAGVSDLNLTNVDLRAGQSNIGSLAGSNFGTINDVTSSGYIGVGAYNLALGAIRIGGLVGLSTDSLINNVSSTVDLGWEALSYDNSGYYTNYHSPNLGGVVGIMSGGTLSNCVYGGDITVNFTIPTRYESVGGISGVLDGSSPTINKCYVNDSTITVSASSVSWKLIMGQFVGWSIGTSVSISESFTTGTFNYSLTTSGGQDTLSGFLGMHQTATINDSFSMVTLNLTNTVINKFGGFIGGQNSQSASSTVTNSYAANPFMSTTTNGVGFAGNSDKVTCTNCYLYDNANVPSQSMTGLTSYTTVGQMQTQGNFAFDFSTPIWKMPSTNPLSPGGLLSPVHNWICGTNGITCP